MTNFEYDLATTNNPGETTISNITWGKLTKHRDTIKDLVEELQKLKRLKASWWFQAYIKILPPKYFPALVTRYGDKIQILRRNIGRSKLYHYDAYLYKHEMAGEIMRSYSRSFEGYFVGLRPNKFYAGLPTISTLKEQWIIKFGAKNIRQLKIVVHLLSQSDLFDLWNNSTWWRDYITKFVVHQTDGKTGKLILTIFQDGWAQFYCRVHVPRSGNDRLFALDWQGFITSIGTGCIVNPISFTGNQGSWLVEWRYDSDASGFSLEYQFDTLNWPSSARMKKSLHTLEDKKWIARVLPSWLQVVETLEVE